MKQAVLSSKSTNIRNNNKINIKIKNAKNKNSHITKEYISKCEKDLHKSIIFLTNLKKYDIMLL